MLKSTEAHIQTSVSLVLIQRLQEQTVAVIKPDVMDKKDEIMKSIEEAGIVVQAEKTVTLTQDEAGSFYDDHKNKEFYGDLCSYMARFVLYDDKKYKNILSVIVQAIIS